MTYRRNGTFIQSNTKLDFKFLEFYHSFEILTHKDLAASLALLTQEHVLTFDPNDIDTQLLVFVKDDVNVTRLAARLPQLYNPETWIYTLPPPSGGPKFIHFRSASRTFDESHAAIAAQGRALFEFHARHAFRGMCGYPTLPNQGGLRCHCERNFQALDPPPEGFSQPSIKRTGCMGMWFPRTDPVDIMLVMV